MNLKASATSASCRVVTSLRWSSILIQTTRLLSSLNLHKNMWLKNVCLFFFSTLTVTDQTALASGQSRAAPVRSWNCDGGLSFRAHCCSWSRSFSRCSWPGRSSSPNRCSAAAKKKEKKKREKLHFYYYLIVCLFLDTFVTERFFFLIKGMWTCNTPLGQLKELPALSSTAVNWEAVVLHATNNCHFTT